MSRPYVYELVDRYNGPGRSSNSDYAWFVDSIGNIRFGLTPAGERRLREQGAAKLAQQQLSVNCRSNTP